MWDAYKGQTSFDVIERDDGFVDAIATSTYLTSFGRWPAHERKAMKLVKGRVLDVGCGAGRVALYLQERGFDVTGLDISPLALKVCRERGLKKTVLGSVQEMKFTANSFDTVVFFGNNFSLMGTPEKAVRILYALQRIVSREGLILAETLDPLNTADPVHLAYHARNRENGRLPGQISMRVRYRQYRTPWFDWLLLSKGELKAIVDGTGWKITELLNARGPQYVAELRKIR
jgi:ubiquinone/menaquinone biosynthesis C-methylase UbiE